MVSATVGRWRGVEATGEGHAFLHQPLEMRCARLASIDLQVGRRAVIGKDEYDVRQRGEGGAANKHDERKDKTWKIHERVVTCAIGRRCWQSGWRPLKAAQQDAARCQTLPVTVYDLCHEVWILDFRSGEGGGERKSSRPAPRVTNRFAPSVPRLFSALSPCRAVRRRGRASRCGR